VIHRLIGFWVLRRAFRILTSDDPRAGLTRGAKRILVGAAITLILLVVAIIILIVLLIALVT
jgi:hypothetical protein